MMHLPPQIGYVAFAALMLLFQSLFVPRKFIRRWFWFCLLWGPPVNFVLVWLLKNLGAYDYTHVTPFDFFGVPTLNALAWEPTIMLFIYFLPRRPGKYLIPVYILSFVFVGMFVGTYYVQLELLHEFWKGGAWMRAPLSTGWFIAALWHYRKINRSTRR